MVSTLLTGLAVNDSVNHSMELDNYIIRFAKLNNIIREKCFFLSDKKCDMSVKAAH